ncbi:MAG: N-acetylmuramoyl-L-alanine amidase [Thermodesulfobacteriota bacterium]
MRLALSTILLFLFLSTDISNASDRGGNQLFQQALELYQTLSSDPDNMNDKEVWITIAKAFNSIYIEYPQSEKAPDALFLSGKMYEEAGLRFDSKDHLEKSVKLSREFTENYPQSPLADDAQIRIARIIELTDKQKAYTEYHQVIKSYPNGNMFNAASSKLRDLRPHKPAVKVTTNEYNTKSKKSSSSGLVSVSKIRRWSTEDYTRVVIHVDKEMPFKHYFLKADKKRGTPPRLFVDIKGTTVDTHLEESIDSGLLESIKFARHSKDTVRVVLYIRSFKDYRVFELHNPFRIVMDIYGKESSPTNVNVAAAPKKPPSPKADISKNIKLETPSQDIADWLGLKVNTVVIDPGHGGHDPGAIGPGGVKEKDVNLKIAKALKKKIEKDGTIPKVILTRTDDRFIPLEERTAIARKLNADLFISIHCNASKRRKAHGIETYILSFTKDPEALEVAARENASNTRGLSDLADIIKKYVLNSKIDQSMSLAKSVQNSIVTTLDGKYSYIKNKGVKKAPFVVLIGTDVPSILIEASFISNPREEKRLKNKKYINTLAEGILAGLKKYSKNKQIAYISK